MKQLYFKYKIDQSGIAIPLLAVAIIALLGLCGLAIDGGRLFLAKERTQRAVDAAAVTTINFRTLNEGATNTELIKIAEDHLRRNLIEMGFDVTPPDATNPDNCCSAAFVSDELQVAAIPPVPLFIMPIIPGIPDYKVVSSSASAKRNEVAVMLVLDASGSMCLDNKTHMIHEPWKCEKMNALKNAARAFINFFDPARDHLGVVSFSTIATVLHPINGPNQPIPVTDIEDSFEIKLNVNDIDTDDIYSNFFWNLGNGNTQVGVPGTDLTGSAGFVWGGTNIEDGITAAHDEFKTVIDAFEADNPGSSANFLKFIVVITDGAPTKSRADNAFAGGSTGRIHFNLALLASDRARSESGISLITIGVGDPDGDTGSAYQSSSSVLIKDIFLRRLANDPISMDDKQFPNKFTFDDNEDEYIDNDERNLPIPSATEGQKAGHVGTFLLSPKTEDLEPLLEQIAQQILTRITD